jgi:hypothetical protein
MSLIGQFVAKITGISDKKKLKKTNSKTYTYGAFNIRSQQLNKFIGKEVMVKVYTQKHALKTYGKNSGKKIEEQK